MTIDEAFSLALSHHRGGRFAEARQIYLQILAVYPHHGDALYLCGLLATQTGDAASAIDLLRRAVMVNPGRTDAQIQLGNCLCMVGQLEDGIESYRAAVRIDATNRDALSRLGNALMMLGRFDESEAAQRRVIELDQTSAVGWTNLGSLFRVQAKVDEAIAAYQQAIAVDPMFAPAFSNLGNVLKDRGKLPEAVAAFLRAVELNPTSAEMHSNLVYATLFCPEFDAMLLLTQARHWANLHEEPLLKFQRPFEMDYDENRRLRIGYVSMDFRDHVVGRNVLPILEHHDHDHFEIHGFSLLARRDSVTARFIRTCDHWHECAALDDAALSEKIRDLKIDILVDLTLHMSGNRLALFARKPAPVQVTWAGYPGTTGLSSMDYRITDPYLDPPGETDACYSEKSIRLPHSFWCYRPIDDAPVVNDLPAASAGYMTFGCLNNFAKASLPARELWADLLLAVPRSRLIVLSSPGSHRAEMTASFTARRIDPARLEFVGLTGTADYLRQYHRIDIAVDPFPYTGHTTTLDALWMGVPVVTLSGPTCVARGSVTALSNVGLTDLIAHTPAEYLSIAANLATDIPRLMQLRRCLRERLRSSPIRNEAVFTADLENAYRQMDMSRAQSGTTATGPL